MLYEVITRGICTQRGRDENESSRISGFSRVPRLPRFSARSGQEYRIMKSASLFAAFKTFSSFA